MCDCIALTDRALAPRNLRLAVTLSLEGGPTRVYLRADPIERRRGQRSATMLPTYCPFCGLRYPDRVDDGAAPLGGGQAQLAARRMRAQGTIDSD